MNNRKINLGQYIVILFGLIAFAVSSAISMSLSASGNIIDLDVFTTQAYYINLGINFSGFALGMILIISFISLGRKHPNKTKFLSALNTFSFDAIRTGLASFNKVALERGKKKNKLYTFDQLVSEGDLSSNDFDDGTGLPNKFQDTKKDRYSKQWIKKGIVSFAVPVLFGMNIPYFMDMSWQNAINLALYWFQILLGMSTGFKLEKVDAEEKNTSYLYKANHIEMVVKFNAEDTLNEEEQPVD